LIMTHPRKQRVLDIFGREPESMDELARCVIAVADHYCERSMAKRNKTTPGARVVGFSWRLVWSPLVSNTHSCPLDGVENFGCQQGKPQGYPGWTGRVWIRYASLSHGSWGSDALKNTLTHTGTGGAGSYDGPWTAVSKARFERHGHKHGPNVYPDIQAYSWDYRIYDQDWPGVTESYSKQHMWNILSNKSQGVPCHEFLWEDPLTKAADRKFLTKQWRADQQELVGAA
jgi:hypothetical protein